MNRCGYVFELEISMSFTFELIETNFVWYFLHFLFVKMKKLIDSYENAVIEFNAF